MARSIVVFALLPMIFCSSPLTAAELTADKLFAADQIVKVDVQIPDTDWRSLCDQSRGNPFGDPSEKPFSYFKAQVKINGHAIENVGIRKKGFIGSLDNFRPSLKIKFDHYQDQQPVDEMVTMTLNNNKQDRSLLSQSITYHLFRKAGVHAPRVSMATVTVNGEYLGIYSHVESMKEPYLKRAFGDATGEFYEGTLADFYPPALERLEPKNAKTKKDQTAARKLAELIEKDEPLDLESLATILDIDNFLRFWAMESLVGFWDGYSQNQNNFFAFQNPKNGKFYFMPWGADGCFGENPFNRFRGGNDTASVVANSMLANRLFHTEGIPERYRATLRTMLDEVWDEEAIVAECERIYALILDEFDEQQFFDAHQAKDELVAFVRGRRAQIEAELENDWPPSIATQPRIPLHFEQVGTATGSFTAAWDSDRSQQANLVMELNGKKRTFESIEVTAGPSDGQGFRFGGFGGRPPDPTVSITLICISKHEDPLILSLEVKRDELEAKKANSVAVTGSVQSSDDNRSRGGRRGPWGGGSRLQGTLSPQAVPVKDGEVLTGKPFVCAFDVKIVEMRGGRR